MRYLITGGAGSLGKALTKNLLKQGHEVAVFSRDEGKHALELKPEVRRFIGDVRDEERVKQVFHIYKPTYVVHAAALKRIDDLELHPGECIKTNVHGTENVCKAALSAEVRKVVLVSTDKACMPVNVYGASKFVAERTMTNFNYYSDHGGDKTVFASVRYGNVIASRGSFVPLWLEKMKNKQEIPITDVTCTRFLFTLDDAAQTVYFALHRAEGGEVFVPDLKSFKITDVLQALASIAGLTKKEAFALVRTIGLRPGEKLHEDMLSQVEVPNAYCTRDALERQYIAIKPQYYTVEDSKACSIYGERYNKWNEPLNSSLERSLVTEQEDIKQLLERGLNESL